MRVPGLVIPPLPVVCGMCADCWGGRVILEPGPLGLVPVVCGRCAGTGEEPRGGN